MDGTKPVDDPTAPKTMLEAMDRGLGYVDEKGEKKPPPGDATAPAAEVPEKKKATLTAPKPAAKAGDAAPKPKGPDAADPLYAMPEGLQPKARERFQALTEGHKVLATELETTKAKLAEVAPQVEALTTQRDSFRQILEETATSSEELNQFFSFKAYLRDKNWKGAAAILQNQLRQLSLQTGEDYGEVDPLDEHEDLREEVDNHTISRERALEIARSRVAGKVSQTQEETRRATEASERQTQEARENGVKAIAEWAKGVAASDIDYAAKKVKLLPKVQEIMRKYPPAQWLTAVQDLYDILDASTPQPPVPRPNGDRPLRPSGGGGRAAPATMGEAIEQGLGYRK